jgi:ATP-dependent Lon protease
MAKTNRFEVPASQLRWRCSPKSLGVRSTDQIKQSREIIGQDRALRALRLGLEMKHPGYNVFVTGVMGTGRMTTIKLLLSEFEKKPIALKDRCYLFNFKNADQPILITLPAGKGKQLHDDLEDLLQELLKNVPSAFESRRHQDERKHLLEHFQDRQRTVLKNFEKKVKDKGFELVQVQAGAGMRPDIAPVVGNQPTNFDQLDTLVQQGMITKEQLEQFTADRAQLESSMEIVFREMRNIDRKAKESLDELSRRTIAPLVKTEIEECEKKYDDAKLRAFFTQLEENIMDDLDRFRGMDEDGKQSGGSAGAKDEDIFMEFHVNVLADNSGTKGVPIIIETNPKFKNLFGTIEREIDRNGVWRTDFSLIKPGSLLLADGGFLVLNALDALSEPNVWTNLKRTLRNGLLEIQSPDSSAGGTSSALKPEPIKIDSKVIMVGDAEMYYLLYEQDEDFKKIFKVRADFDVEMPNNKTTVRKYLMFAKMVCDEEKLLPFDATALSAVVEYGARLSGKKNKLSTRFTAIADVLRESSYWAAKERSQIVSSNHVLKALYERIERVKLVEEKLSEMILEGSIFIDTRGSVVGQVNGLSVIDMGEYMFGKPVRITARTSIGRQGIVNIEREAALSGPTHNKGVLILGGVLRSAYARNKPLVLNASIAFEQSYSGVDGDSASSTEIYALLSSIAELPLRQDVAVTGSINQRGEVQPVGGVNQKIEGFFDICRVRGLTGTQGVMIPMQNIPDLMLRHDVIDAVEAGKFHIYAVRTLDEGIELLTGIKAGKRSANGLFESGSVHARVDAKLTEYAKHWNELIKGT